MVKHRTTGYFEAKCYVLGRFSGSDKSFTNTIDINTTVAENQTVFDVSLQHTGWPKIDGHMF